MNSILQSKIETSIATIQRAAKLAKNYTGKPLVVAFSGGKDSQTVYHLAEAAGVEFEAVYSATTIDPPEIVRLLSIATRIRAVTGKGREKCITSYTLMTNSLKNYRSNLSRWC